MLHGAISSYIFGRDYGGQFARNILLDLKNQYKQLFVLQNFSTKKLQNVFPKNLFVFEKIISIFTKKLFLTNFISTEKLFATKKLFTKNTFLNKIFHYEFFVLNAAPPRKCPS